MNERQRRIDEIEAKATESELIGRLATDPEIRIYNLRLGEELRAYAQQLKMLLASRGRRDHGGENRMSRCGRRFRDCQT